MTYNITPSVHISACVMELTCVILDDVHDQNRTRTGLPHLSSIVSFFFENFGRNIVGRPTCYKIGGRVVQCDNNISTFAKSLKDIAYLYCR